MRYAFPPYAAPRRAHIGRRSGVTSCCRTRRTDVECGEYPRAVRVAVQAACSPENPDQASPRRRHSAARSPPRSAHTCRTQRRSVHYIVRYLRSHVGPAPLDRHPVQLQPKILQAMQRQDRHVGARRTIESDPTPHDLHRLCHRTVIRPGCDETAAVHIEILPRPPTTCHADSDLRQAHVLQVAPRAERVQPDAIGHLPGNAQHRLTDRGYRHRHHRQPGRLG